MLTKEEENYLSKINPRRITKIYPYNPNGKELGEKIVKQIKKVLPDANILFMGSVALKISGQKDIDIYILSDVKHFDDYLPELEKLFGVINKQGDYVKKKFVEWKFEQDGYDIEIYLTEPPQRQINVYNILKSNPILLKKYENLKMKFKGKLYKDYQKAKYEFYNKILSKTYHLDINNRAFQAIKNRTKQIEYRTNTSSNKINFAEINIGDIINFNNENDEIVKTIVKRITHYNNANELYKNEGLNNSSSKPRTINEAVKRIESLKGYKKGIKTYGIWAIELNLI